MLSYQKKCNLYRKEEHNKNGLILFVNQLLKMIIKAFGIGLKKQLKLIIVMLL